MRLKIALPLFAITLFILGPKLSVRANDTTGMGVLLLPPKYIDDVGRQSKHLESELNKKTAQYLRKLSRIEGKILSKLHVVDSLAGFGLPPGRYNDLLAQMVAPSGVASNAGLTYIPGLDTLSTTIRFLVAEPGFSESGSISQANSQVQLLQSRMNVSSIIQQYISERKAQLGAILNRYSNLPVGVTKAFSNYKETAYYYRQQVEAYKAMINDPDKMERLAVSILSKVPAYRTFLAENSILAALFQLPSSYGNGGSVQGLQTRTELQQVLQQGIGGASNQGVQQQLQAAQSQITNMQNGMSKYGVGGQDLDMPEFKPNTQKTKTFLNRLEYGMNIQFARAAYNFPSTAELALSTGYRLNDMSTIGAGVSYNFGFGSGWNSFAFSNQGVGLRSFMDWRIKRTYYVSGGYELNYMTAFKKIVQLESRAMWQPSALIGLEKKYKISSKLQGNIQLLGDILYKNEIPQGEMIKFRVGYNF